MSRQRLRRKLATAVHWLLSLICQVYKAGLDQTDSVRSSEFGHLRPFSGELKWALSCQLCLDNGPARAAHGRAYAATSREQTSELGLVVRLLT